MMNDSFDEVENLHHAVGMAIDSWAMVEHGLVLIFWTAIQCPDFDLASRVFHAPLNFNIRLTMTDEAVTGAFEVGIFPERLKQLADPWSSIYKDIDTASRNRNSLAHYVVHKAPDAEPGKKAYLHPSGYDRGSRAQRKKDRWPKLYANTVYSYIGTFHILTDRLGEFWDELRVPPTLRPPFRE